MKWLKSLNEKTLTHICKNREVEYTKLEWNDSYLNLEIYFEDKKKVNKLSDSSEES